MLTKDVEVMRLIEERRKMPIEERQRLKELSKEIKNASEKKKNEKTIKTLRIHRCPKYPENQNSKEESPHHKDKEQKGECITSRKGIADTFGEFYKRLCEDSGKDNSEHEKRDDKRIPEITSEELQSAISRLKAGKSPDGNAIRAKTSKIATMKREK